MKTKSKQKIPKGWKKTQDLRCKDHKIYSGGTPNTALKEYWGGDLNWLSSGETKKRFITETENKITKKGSEKSSTKLAKKNTIVVATAGQGLTRGQVSILKTNSYINQSLIAIDVDGKTLNHEWLFYNLSYRYKELRKISDTNSIRGSITTEMIKGLYFLKPGITEQKAIADVLSSFDDKIELLREQNKTFRRNWKNNF